MGYQVLPAPGKVIRGVEIGACLDENCGHKSCEQIRKWANTRCRICGKPIDYETAFYIEDITNEVLTHASCYIDEIEKEQ